MSSLAADQLASSMTPADQNAIGMIGLVLIGPRANRHADEGARLKEVAMLKTSLPGSINNRAEDPIVVMISSRVSSAVCGYRPC